MKGKADRNIRRLVSGLWTVFEICCRQNMKMNVLVINCGSSSLKYQLINSDSEAVLAKGLCERIGIDGRLVYQKTGCDKEITEAAMPTHKEAIQMVLDALTNDKTGAIGSLKEVNAVGHRVVHGGEKFAKSVVITDEVISAVEECNDLAPLHNPANLIGIRVCSELMPGVPQVAVFDTAFHQTMPAKAYLYGLPIEYYKNYKVRRYGFHGTSHSFVSKRAVEFLGLDKDNSKVIVCHLGNGSSISAVVNGDRRHFPLAPSINAAASRSKSEPESKAFTSHPSPAMIFLSPGFFFVKSTFCPFDKLIGISFILPFFCVFIFLPVAHCIVC